MTNALDVNVEVIVEYEAQIMSTWTERLRAYGGENQKLHLFWMLLKAGTMPSVTWCHSIVPTPRRKLTL